MTPTRTLLRLTKYFFRYKWRIIGGLISVAIMSSADTASAFLVARLFEVLQNVSEHVRTGAEMVIPVEIRAFGHTLYSLTIHGRDESFRMITQFAVAVIVIIIVKVTFVYVREYLMSSVQQKIIARFRIDLFERISMFPVRFFDSHKTGFIMSRITNDVTNIEQSLYQLVEISQNIIYSMVFAAALFYTTWKLTIVTILIFALSGEISRKFGDRIRSYSRELTNTLADISAFLQERITAVRLVKLFTREQHEQARFKQKVETNYHFSMKIVRVVALLSPTNELFNTVAGSLLVIATGYLFIQGSMTIESMIFFLMVMINLAKPVKALGESAARIQKTLVSAGLIFELLDREVEPVEGGNRKHGITKGSIAMENVTFSYKEGVEALRGVSFRIVAGERIALVGPSGGGKTTILNLIPRFYEVNEGRVLVDGVDVREYGLRSLRGSIAMVPQDVILFSGSIEENIRYGNLSASRSEVIEAAKSANAHSFIERLEKGYETEVGERGLQLSGGQRQRIAIARAILRDPKILLLDEATSALDTESERMVQEALNRLMVGRTSLIIAHRLSTITHCDRILVLDRGKLVEQGTHRQLLSRDGGLFKRLHAMQFTEGHRKRIPGGRKRRA